MQYIYVHDMSATEINPSITSQQQLDFQVTGIIVPHDIGVQAPKRVADMLQSLYKRYCAFSWY